MKREHERREHIRREFRDERPRGEIYKHHRFPRKLTTKLFTSKEELVAYVNDIGETGAKIDVFKIEDGLYKVEVIERQKKDIEIEVE